MDAIASTTSLIGRRPLCGVSARRRQDGGQQKLFSVSAPRRSSRVFWFSPVKALAMEVTKEANWSKEGSKISIDRVWPPPNKADNPSLHNPLRRLERMGCGWLGVILEWEGVIVEDDASLEKQAWLMLAQEEGKSPPPSFLLRRIEGMKNEQAISEVLCWCRDPSQLRRLSSRKEEIFQGLHGGFYQLRPGSQEFISALANHNIPIALASTRPTKHLQAAIESAGVKGSFEAIVTAEDVYRGKPDPEMFEYAAQLLNFIPERCIVFGNSNSTVEAAHDAKMKCVAVASKHPVYELGAADLVIRRLDELSIVDLKNLADIESPEFGSPEPEPEMEEEPQTATTAVAVDDIFW
ncbi:haloacid dehalogenase-like hydrolase (HAD) superfamily protein [Wolffia australiana]